MLVALLIIGDFIAVVIQPNPIPSWIVLLVGAVTQINNFVTPHVFIDQLSILKHNFEAFWIVPSGLSLLPVYDNNGISFVVKSLHCTIVILLHPVTKFIIQCSLPGCISNHFEPIVVKAEDGSLIVDLYPIPICIVLPELTIREFDNAIIVLVVPQNISVLVPYNPQPLSIIFVISTLLVPD